MYSALRAIGEQNAKAERSQKDRIHYFLSMREGVSGRNAALISNEVIKEDPYLEMLRCFWRGLPAQTPANGKTVPRMYDILDVATGNKLFGDDPHELTTRPRITIKELITIVVHRHNMAKCLQIINKFRCQEKKFQMHYYSDASVRSDDPKFHVRYLPVEKRISFFLLAFDVITHI